MSLYFTSINSGSNGNCYYIGNETEAVLVDIGLSCKEIEKRMDRLGLSLHKVKAIFISHEHTDHIKGLAVLAKKYSLPIFITQNTLINSRLNLNPEQIRSFTTENPICIGNLKIFAFSKLHDAADPYSFVVECNEIRVGVFTDIGLVCNNLINHFKTCHAAFLEANYDTDMLENGSYPYYLKKRITNGRGHLSNAQALELFLNHKPDYMSHLLLSHLSKDNNDPELVEHLFKSAAGNTVVGVASRNEESPIFFTGEQVNQQVLNQYTQLNLFSAQASVQSY